MKKISNSNKKKSKKNKILIMNKIKIMMENFQNKQVYLLKSIAQIFKIKICKHIYNL